MGKVLFVSSIKRFGGGERWMCDAALGLGARGHEVALIARPGSALEEKRGRLGLDGAAVEMRGDLDPSAVVGMAGTMRRFRPDAVCANLDREIRISVLAVELARVAGLATRSRFRPPRLVPRRGSEFPLKNKLHYRLVYTKFVDRVIVNSNATKETMLSDVPWFDRDKAVVIYNGIDFGPYEALDGRRDESRRRLRSMLGVPIDASIVLLVGELTERKGHRFLVQAAPEVIDKHPNTHFLFVGEGSGRADVEDLVQRSGREDHFHLVGFREDVPEFLAASDILVLPSTIEGFGYVLVEAMAAALPVVASKSSSIPEIVDDGETGYLHAVGDPRAIAERLSRLLVDPQLRKAMGEEGRRRAKKRFSMDRMLDRLEEVFFAGRRGHATPGS